MPWPFRRRSRVEPSPTPAAGEVDAAAIVRRARRLRFRVRPESVRRLAGAYLGARPGEGLTFAELRAYEPGDDVRRLDWNVTARQGRPFVRRYLEERSLVLWLVLDASASMRFGREARSKADRAAQAAALLATAAIHNGDRVGLLIVSDRVELEIPAAGGVRHLARIARALVAAPATSRKTSLQTAIPRLRRAARRAMIVVLSDFPDEPAAPWRRVARRHDVIGLRVVDPLEERLPDVGLIAVREAEANDGRVVDAHRPRLRAAYARRAVERRRAFARWCVSARVDGHDMPTDAEPLQTLLRVFERRATRQRRP